MNLRRFSVMRWSRLYPQKARLPLYRLQYITGKRKTQASYMKIIEKRA